MMSEAEAGRHKSEDYTLVKVQHYSSGLAARSQLGSLPFIHANTPLIPTKYLNC